MIKIFNKIRKRLLANGNLSQYLLYAAGEIVLVVIGILLALQINGWNEARKNAKQLNNILGIIQQDIINDTLEVSQILENYKQRRPVFEKVLKDSATFEDYKNQPFFGVLITSYVPFSIEKRGYMLLNQFNNFNEKEQEAIVTQVTQFYSVFIKSIEDNEKAIKEDVFNNMEYWKENMSWFATVSQGKIPYEFMNYVINEPDYKNRVAYHRAFVYSNHIPNLELFKIKAKALLKNLDKRL